jgi:hypothetical protein
MFLVSYLLSSLQIDDFPIRTVVLDR